MTERCLLWLALSGGAIVVERLTAAAPSPYWKEEDGDAMLWKASNHDAPDALVDSSRVPQPGGLNGGVSDARRSVYTRAAEC
jgi:hypothetical protein